MSVDRIARIALRALGVRSRLVDTGIAVHHVYDTGGENIPIVCLPGLADTAASWIPVILALRHRRYRVLVVEAAGHGLSRQARGTYTIDAHLASMTAALDELVEEPAFLVGNSLGGATALHYACARPAAVRGLFLTSPGGGIEDEASLAALRATFQMQSVRDARAFVDRVFHRPPRYRRLLSRLVLARSASRAVADIISSLRADHVLADIASIVSPIRLVWGRSERLLPSEALAWFREHLPWQALIVEPEGFGHCPHLDDPLRLARMINSFVSGTGTSAMTRSECVVPRTGDVTANS